MKKIKMSLRDEHFGSILISSDLNAKQKTMEFQVL